MGRTKRKRQKPVMNDHGEWVTPVSGLPAAPINWAPPCPACKARTCNTCGHVQHQRFPACRECNSADMSDSHACNETVSTGTRESVVGVRQRVKCKCCGWTWTHTPKR